MIFRATEQWFIDLEHDRPAPTRAARTRSTDPKCNGRPDGARERIHSMIAERPDWCVSRQRFWGVPLVVFYCDECGKRLEDFAALRARARLVRARRRRRLVHALGRGVAAGRNALRVRRSALAQGKRHSRRLVRFRLDASRRARPAATPTCRWPADMYLEGPDQYRGWFHSSLLIGVGVRGRRALPARAHARLDARRRRPADVEVARQRRAAHRSLREVGRRSAAPLGRLAGLPRPTCACPTT